MSNELIEAFDTDTLPTNPNQLKEFARKKAVFIAQRVHNLTQNLEKAKKLSAEAGNAKNDLRRSVSDAIMLGSGIVGVVAKGAGLRFGKTATEKRSEINTEAIILQNEAIAELANLVQASIQFAGTSAVLNQAMLEELTKVCNEGFIDVYGKVQEIRDEEEKRYLKQIENGLRNNQKIHQQRESTAKNQASILQNAESISANKDLISQNAELIAQNQQAINNIKILAWIAIALSVASLSISIFCFLK